MMASSAVGREADNGSVGGGTEEFLRFQQQPQAQGGEEGSEEGGAKLIKQDGKEKQDNTGDTEKKDETNKQPNQPPQMK